MPYLLRKIDSRSNWYAEAEFSQYIPRGEAPADALNDLRTQENKLSVWHIEDNRSNLRRVVAAIAAGRQNLQKLDFIVFDRRLLEESELRIQLTTGATPDSGANSQWHLEVFHLSASALSRLANAMFAHGERDRKFDSELVPLIRESISDGHISVSDLQPNVAARVTSK